MLTDSSRVPLARRAWIGDGRRGALVTADGTIDWFSPDGISHPTAFWRLLDPAGGALRVGPVREGTGVTRNLPASTQSYRPGSNTVETVIDAGRGRSVVVVDALPWLGPYLDAPGRVVRLVRALAGPVDVEIEVLPSGRLGAAGSVGASPAREVAASEGAIVVDGLAVRAGVRFEAAPLSRDEPRWRAVHTLDAGEALVVTAGPAETDLPLTARAAQQLIDDADRAWRSWGGLLAYDGPYRDAVERALLAVRSLTVTGGAPTAAGTTSLPRRVGGERTSDDRWVKLRDAASAARILARAGLAEDAEGAETWLRAAVTDAPVPWPVVLDPDGQPVPEVEELSLEGWRRGQPVVLGWDGERVDLGVFGDVVSAVGASATGPGGRAGDAGQLSAAWPALAAAADWVADHWRQPDSGVWLTAGPARALVTSRLDAWYGLDRMARLARAANPLDLDAVGWQQGARAVAAWLEEWAITPDGGLGMEGAGDSESRSGASEEPDAALLSVAWRGPWPDRHPVVAATVDRVLERLGSGSLVYRYSDRVDDGRAGGDSPDLVASLWAVKALARLERWDEAHERMEAVVGLARQGGLGLLSEAADPVSGELLGNLPCTAAHLALAEAAMELAAGPK